MTDKTYDRPPEMALKPGYEYHANFVTEKGTGEGEALRGGGARDGQQLRLPGA